MHLHIALHKQQLKTAMLPIAMIGGAVFYKWMGYLNFLSPYLIFAMLFITYCKIEPRDIRPHKFHFILLTAQMALAALVYLVCLPLGPTIADGVFICVYIPTATAAPVITAMLGGSISKVATYSLLCNAFVAVTGPIILALIGNNADMTFLQSFLIILSKVAPLILGPLALAFILRYATPDLHRKIMKQQQLSFYLWAVSLFIVVGGCVSFAINNWSDGEALNIALLTAGALAVCLLQFKIGRYIGGKFGDKVSGGQSLGQKNTVLAVWLALTYMNPIASIGPAAYIAWQNMVNSWQLMRRANSNISDPLANDR